MKNLLKKNQVIITALVIMVAVAGYLSFTNDSANSLKESSKTADSNNIKDVPDNSLDNDLYVDINNTLDTKETSAQTKEQTDSKKTKKTKTDEFADISAEDNGNDLINTAKTDTSNDTAGDAILVSNTINKDYFTSAKISREQTRAKNKETLMNIVNNANVKETEKTTAINEIINMTKIADKESSAEILLKAKGFDDVVISVVDNKADVLVNGKNLTEQQMAQIEDIVKRKTGLDAKNIVITPVGVVEK